MCSPCCGVQPLNIQFRLKEDDLAGRLGLQLKELSKLTAVLNADKLLKM